MTLMQTTDNTPPKTSFNGIYQIHHIIPVEMFNSDEFGQNLRDAIGSVDELQSRNNRIAMFTNLESAQIYQQLQKDYPQLKGVEFGGTWHQSYHKEYSRAVA